jgi:DNA helicase-2/ATP-dependent DNA helicase PcrA
MDLNYLNPSQKQAVFETEGPVMILAGAGSGKTRTLVSRIQYLLEEKNISPFQILAVTFSNKAAKEMRERLSQSSKVAEGALQVTTFHAFCAKILRTDAQFLGLSRSFTIYDDSETQTIIKHILNKHGISPKEISPYTVSSFIDSIKNAGVWKGQVIPQELIEIANDVRFVGFYNEYESELHRSNALDFGGLITGVLQLFSQFPEVLEKYQRKYKYVLVDEYQDTNRAQFNLIKLLSESNRNICVVGDEDQSIYSWRGADIRNILDFEKIFPEAKLIKLEQNYRSSQTIIKAATDLISNNIARKGKSMWTDNPEGDFIEIVETRDEKAEADFVTDEIKKLYKEGVSPKEIAIFYRNNAQSRVIEDSLRREKFNYRVVAGIRFYDRKEIKDMLSYLRVVVNKKDSLAFTRVVNTPARGIGATSLRKLEDEAIAMNLSLFELMEEYFKRPEEFKHLSLSSKAQSSLRSFINLIQEVQLLDSENSLPSFSYEKLLHESGYLEHLKADRSYEGLARLENLEELLSAIKQFENNAEEANLVKFIESVSLDGQTENETGESVSLMTVHGSKGLEYSYVFLVGAESNIFPSFKSLESGAMALEEERRLFYVAMTRAMKKLFITFAQGRMLWGSLKFNGPSQFINEIPKNYYKWTNLSKHTQNQNAQFAYDDFDQRSDYDEDSTYVKKYYQGSTSRVLQSKYQRGIKVKHSLYGEGTVLESEGFGQEEKVVINFRDGAKKKFMVKFAPLEIL